MKRGDPQYPFSDLLYTIPTWPRIGRIVHGLVAFTLLAGVMFLVCFL